MALIISKLDPLSISEGFFKQQKVYQLITKFQQMARGEDYKGRKVVTRSRRKDPLNGIYSAVYAVEKRALGKDTTRFNFNLTGKFHNSFIQIPKQNQLEVYAETKKGNKDLKAIYPDANRFSNESINKIIRGDKEYLQISLLEYCRKAILANIFIRK